MKPKVLFLLGPTGSGKSEVAVYLAKKLNGEIISCDSMVIYKAMNIGTAKPSRKEQKGIPHHLIDLRKPREQFSVSEFRKLALKAIEKIVKKGKVPIVVGGSGLYAQSLTDGLVPESKKTMKARKALEKRAKTKGAFDLYMKLQEIDPVRAKEIQPNDARRIIRALEIYETYQVKPSDWRKKRVGLNELGYDFVLTGLVWDRQVLYNRINERVRKMIEKGFVQEVKRLKRSGLSKTARQAIGYAEILNYLNGKMSLPQAIEITQKRSRNLAKKQLIWFRKETRIRWIGMKPKFSPGQVAKKVADIFTHTTSSSPSGRG